VQDALAPFVSRAASKPICMSSQHSGLLARAGGPGGYCVWQQGLVDLQAGRMQRLRHEVMDFKKHDHSSAFKEWAAEKNLESTAQAGAYKLKPLFPESKPCKPFPSFP